MDADVKVALRQSFLPLVLVLCPKQVDDLCIAKSGQTFAHWLQTHNAHEVLSREASGPGLKVRFSDPADVQGVPDASLGDYVQRAAAAASSAVNDYGGFAIRCAADVEQFLRAFPDPTPWFGDWRAAYLRGLPASAHSGVGHPVACVIVVPGGPPLDVSAAGAVAALWAVSDPPPLYHALRFLDPTIPRFYAVLQHGPDADSTRAAEQRLAELHGIYGAKNCSMLRFAALATSAAPAKRARLSPADVQELERFVRIVMAVSVIPFLHSTINALLQQQAMAKKGLGSRMKTFFRLGSSSAPPPTATPSPTASPVPPTASPPPDVTAMWGNVSPTRRLADFQFLAGDYDNAAKTYQQVLSELKGERLTCAAAHELLGLSNFLADTAKAAAAETSLEQAYQLFFMSGEKRFAARAAVIHALVLLSRGQGLKAFDVLTHAAENVCVDEYSATILHEQAAFCYLRLPQPMLRKFCFRLVVAGHRFGLIAGQSRHAVRCYRLAYGMYSGLQWAHIDDYMHLALVRHSFDHGVLDDVDFYIRKLVERNRQPFYVQAAILRQLLFLYRRRAAAAPPPASPSALPDLPLPNMLQDTFALRLNDDPPACESDKCPLALTRWADLRVRVAFVGEQVHVDVDIANPFAIPIQFGQAHAVCDFEPSPPPSPSPPPQQQQQPSHELAVATVPPKAPLPTFDAQLYDILLCPSECKRMSFVITPRSEGTLRLRGIAFSVCMGIWGMRRFAFALPKKNGASDPDTLRVAAAMPHLRVDFQGFPAWAVEGELSQVTLVLHNTSSVMGASDIRISFSHPSFFALNKDSSKVAATIIPPVPPVTPGRMGSTDDTDSLTWMAIDAELPPNGDMAIPFWFRVHGNCSSIRHTFHTAVSYKTKSSTQTPATRAPQARFAHVHNQLSVQPAVRITHTLLPNAADVNSMLLKLQVDNLQTGLLLKIKQFSCLSKKWTLGTLYPISEESMTLKPKERSNFFLNVSVSQAREPECRHTVVAPGMAKQVDASASPYCDFVQKEASALWEAQKAGGRPLFGVVKQRRSPSSITTPGSYSMGLSAFGALPSFANAHKRAVKEEAPRGPPEIDDITVIWETASATAAGPATLLGVSNLCIPSQSLPCAPDLFPSVVRVSSKCDGRVSHDFSGGMCTVPVVVTVRNCSLDRHLSVSLDTLHPDFASKEWIVGESLGSGYFWSGLSNFPLDTRLAPLQSREVILHACFQRPGVYNVNTLRVTVADDSGKVLKSALLASEQRLVVISDVTPTEVLL